MPVREHVQQQSATDDGERLCSRAEWCSNPRIGHDGGRTVRLAALTPRSFCDRDEQVIGRYLREMPGQYLHLKHELGNPNRSGQPVRVPFGPRVPLRVDVDALMCLMSEALCSWHERVADDARLSFPPAALSRQRRDMLAVKQAADVLSGRMATLLGLEPRPVRRAVDLRDLGDWPDSTDGIVHAAFAELDLDMGGADAGLEILHLHYLARAALGETRAKPEELDGIACRADGCGLRLLVRAEPPSDPSDPGKWSYCLGCEDTMAEDEYREWVALCAAYERNARRVPVLENLPGVA